MEFSVGRISHRWNFPGGIFLGGIPLPPFFMIQKLIYMLIRFIADRWRAFSLAFRLLNDDKCTFISRKTNHIFDTKILSFLKGIWTFEINKNLFFWLTKNFFRQTQFLKIQYFYGCFVLRFRRFEVLWWTKNRSHFAADIFIKVFSGLSTLSVG